MSRTIVVGDVHGCAKELSDLFDALALTSSDQVVMVGDLIAKGPSSMEVLRMAREIGAITVRGNHETRLLRWLKHPNDHAHHPRLAETARSMDDDAWSQIEAMPLWVEQPSHELLVVHAGLVPGKPLQEQAEEDLLHMRCINEHGEADARRPPEGEEHRLWGNHYTGPPHVVFGHNARNEPQLHPAATGLDTGCVYGGRLTALVLRKNEPVAVDNTERQSQLFSVPARETYVPID